MNYAGLSTGAVGQAYTTDRPPAARPGRDQAALPIAAGTTDIKSLFASNGATGDIDGLMQRVSDTAFNATRPTARWRAAITAARPQSQDITNSINAMQRCSISASRR